MRKSADAEADTKTHHVYKKDTTTFTPIDHHNQWKIGVDLILRFLRLPLLVKFGEW